MTRALRKPTALLLSWVFPATTLWGGQPGLLARGEATERAAGARPGWIQAAGVAQQGVPGFAMSHPGGGGHSPRPIRPILECVAPGADGYVAHFGYKNENDEAVTIPVGASNAFFPPPGGRGQPTVFQPGRTPFYLNAAFAVPFAGGNLVWTLRGPDGATRTATASPNSQGCAPPPSACSASLFGPQRYTRTNGPPNEFTATVRVPAWVVAPYRLRIQNGGADGKNRVSSAWIAINGVEVAGPSDFNPNVASLEREVALSAESTLFVRLASKPGSYLVLSLCGASGDATPPALTWIEPAPASATNDTTPRLVVRFQDPAGSGEPAASGPDASTLRVTLDGVDRTALFSVRDGEASAELPQDLALAEGLHSLSATIEDLAGNAGEATAEFHVDLTPPAVAFSAPAPGSFLSTPSVGVALGFSDSGGVELSSLRFLVDGADRTALLFASDGQATASLEGLASGPHLLEAAIRDTAGNSATAAPVSFTLDLSPPSIAIARPTQGSRHGATEVEVLVTYADDQSLDLESFASTVDGQPVPLGQGTDVAFGSTGVLSEGSHLLRVAIRDRAGNAAEASSEFQVDLSAPDLCIEEPLAGFAVNTHTPRVTVSYADAQGIDLASLRIRVDGIDRTALLSAGPAFAQGVLAGDAALPDGSHTVLAEIRDVAGNLATSSASFTVDTTPPAARLDRPFTPTSAALPEIRLSYTDSGSGVDPASVQVSLDGEEQAFAIGDAMAVGSPATPLADGAHEMRILVSDRAGNAAEPSFAFVVDTAAPLLALASPAPDSFTNRRDPSLRLTFSDASGSGVDPASLHVFLAPVLEPSLEREVTAELTIGADGATGPLAAPGPLSDGSYRLRAQLADRAGNVASLDHVFTVDSVAPTYTIAAPDPDAWLSTATPSFLIRYSDDRSGIDLSAFAFRIDGVARTEDLARETDRAEGGLAADHAVAEGRHTLEVSVVDRAANAAATQPPSAFLVDLTPPTVAIEAPGNGAWVGVFPVPVRVVYADADAGIGNAVSLASVRLELDGIDRTADFTLLSTGAEATFSLPEGPHALEVELQDLAGNPASASAAFTVDTLAPVVPSVSLQDGQYLAELDPSGRVRVSGTVEDLDPTVAISCVVGGTAFAARVTGGQFSCDVPLQEGENQVRITASDRTLHETSVSRTVKLDTIDPQVHVVRPAEGEYVSAHAIEVEGGVVDASPLTVRVGSVAAEMSGSSFLARGVALGDGPVETVVVEAEDAAGNVGSAALTLRVDRDAPQVAITQPLEGAFVHGPFVVVRGTVSDASPVMVDVNGTPAALGAGTFEAQVPISDGATTLTATARDAASNSAFATVSVNIDTTPPVLTLTEPPPGQLTKEVAVRVAGTIADQSPVVVRFAGSPVPVSNGYFAFDAPLLAEGANLLTVTATDAAGNEASASVSVLVDRTPPALEIASPMPGAVIGAFPVVVQGTVNDALEVQVLVNGEAAARVQNAWQASLASLPEGPQAITVVATDAAGNQATRSIAVQVDLAPPVVQVTVPASAAMVGSSFIDVSGIVRGASIASVVVNGVPAMVQAPGGSPFACAQGCAFAAPGVPLVEGDNHLVATATSPSGRTGTAEVVVTLDVTPPVVTLDAPERLVRGQPAQALVTATDNLAIAQVVIKLDDVVIATLTAAPYVVDLVVPDGAKPGETLTVVAEATDRAGHTVSASRGVRVAAQGAIVGQALSAATGLLVAGARVSRVAAAGGQRPGGGEPQDSTLTDERGRYSLPVADATAVLLFEKDAFTSVERAVAVETGTGTVPVDARLTPLAEPVVVGAAGGELSKSVRLPWTEAAASQAAAQLTLTVPQGVLPADTQVHLTPLSGQGLPALLPLGWSPLAAVQLDAANLTCPSGGCPVRLACSACALPAAVHLARHSTTLHAWELLAPGLVPASGEIAFLIPGPGSYALVVPDADGPSLPDLGELLSGLDMAEVPPTAASSGTVDPATIPASGETALGMLSVQSPEPLPSGTVVQARITETYTLASGDVASEETRDADIVLYRSSAADADTLQADFPITPSRTYSTVDLIEGKVHLDILAGREGVRGIVGGSEAVSIDTGTVRLRIPAFALAEDTAFAISEGWPLSGLAVSAPGLDPVAELSADFSGKTLSQSAELSATVSSISPTDALLVAKVVRLDSVPKLAVVALGELDQTGTRVVSKPSPGLPGILEGGWYVIYRSALPIGFVSGTTSSSAGPVSAVVEQTAGLPFIAVSSATGRYTIATPVGSVSLTARVLHSSLIGSGTATVLATEPATLDLTLAGAVTTATVEPADGSVGVPTSVQVTLTSTAPLRPDTVTAEHVRLLKDGVPVSVRLVLAGTGKSLSVVPSQALAFSTQYAFEATGLVDVYGGAVVVPQVSFTTKADVPPVYDTAALRFSMPGANGMVTLSAPPGTLPPGTEVLILNSTSGFVATFTAENDGAVGHVMPATFPASISDVLLVTVTDPAGNVTTFKRSEFVELDGNGQPTGVVAIGPGGGKVAGAGAEMRIPEGALSEGVRLRIAALTAAELESLFPGQKPDFGTDNDGNQRAHLGGGMRIESPDMPSFKKAAVLAFPVPDFSTAPEERRPPKAEDAFYYVLRRVEGPCPSGAATCEASERPVLWETIANAFVEGTGASAKVVTACPPLADYVSSVGRFVGGALVGVATNHLYLMWSYDQSLPGKPLAGAVSGKVRRTAWQQSSDGGSGSPVYEPIAKAVVRAWDAGRNEFAPAIAQTGADGQFTLWDPAYVGGTVQIAAGLEGKLPEGGCDPPSQNVQCATAYEGNPADWSTTGLRFYRNIAHANVTFPAVQPAVPPSAVSVGIYRIVDGAVTGEAAPVVVVGSPVQVRVTVSTDAGSVPYVSTVRIEGVEYGLQQIEAGVWQAIYTPTAVGRYTVSVAALPPFGAPLVAHATFRVVASGGSAIEPLPDAPPAVITQQTFPVSGARDVPVTVLPEIYFTEPVRQIAAHVSLSEEDGSAVQVRISGVTPTGDVVEDVAQAGPGDSFTSITIEPLPGLKHGRTYRLVLTSGIVDTDLPPKALDPAPFETRFTTFSPTVLTDPGASTTQGSPGIGLIGTRAFLVESYFTSGVVRVFDVSDPAKPDPILPQDPQGSVTWRPVDISADPGSDRLLVATGPPAKSTPSNLYLFDVNDRNATVWQGAVSLSASASEGTVVRALLRGDRAYAVTQKKGLQVVDVNQALEVFVSSQEDETEHWRMRQAFNTDGQGFGQAAVVATIPLPSWQDGSGATLLATPTDLAVVDTAQSGAWVLISGNPALTVVDPAAGSIVRPPAPVEGDVDSQSGPVHVRLASAQAITTGVLDGTPVALLAGYGTVSGGDSVPLLVVLNITDPAQPELVGYAVVEHMAGTSLAIVDVALKDRMALVSAQAGTGAGATASTFLFGLEDLTAPRSLGAIQGFGGMLAVGDRGLIFATARRPFGGSPDPMTGVQAASLEPCFMIQLRTPKVMAKRIVDPANQHACPLPATIVFTLCRAASVTLTGVQGVLDPPAACDARPAAGPISEVSLDPGTHVIALDEHALLSLDDPLPFTIEARALDGSDQREAVQGQVIPDVKNRSVLPVGRTFVKGVDLFDGHVVRQSADIKLRGRHLGLEVVRSYSSSARGTDGVMGAGWTFNYAADLAEDFDCGLVSLQTADGSSVVFQTSDFQSFKPQKGYHGKLRTDGLGAYVYTDKSGTVHRFEDTSGRTSRSCQPRFRLVSITEPHRDKIELSYDTLGRLAAVSEVQPERGAVRSLSLSYTEAGGFDRVLRIEGLGHVVTYAYDDDGNLVQVTRSGVPRGVSSGPAPDQVEKYEYLTADRSDPHQLTAAIDPNDRRVEYAYHAAGSIPGLSGRAQEYAKTVIEDPLGADRAATGFTYALSPARTTTVTDPRPQGHQTVYTLNQNGSPLVIEEPGRRTEMQWATDDIYKTWEKDANNRETELHYDPNGNLTDEIVKTGDAASRGYGDVTTHYEYHQTFNKLTLKRDAEGRETNYTLDQTTGDLRFLEDAVGNKTEYGYDDHGQLTYVIDPRGNKTQHSDPTPFGDAQTINAPEGLRTTKEFDARGRLTASSDTFGHNTSYTYDQFDRVLTETKVPGHGSDLVVTTTSYYPAGQAHTVRNPKGAVTTYTLDGLNRVTDTSVVVPGLSAPATYSTNTVYDQVGNKVQETDRRGVTRSFGYDGLNQLRTVEILPGEVPGPTGPVASYYYDAVGNKTDETDELKKVKTHYDHDKLYRATKKTISVAAGGVADPAAPYVEQYGYDKVGNKLFSKDPNGTVTRFEYDPLNRVILERRDADGLNLTVRREHNDPEGSHVNRSLEHDVTRGLRTTFSYDALNREVSRTVKLEGPGSPQGNPGYVMQTTYEIGDQTKVVRITGPAPDYRTVERHLDGLDRVYEEVIDPGGLQIRTTTTYDGLGNKRLVTGPRSDQQTKYDHDGLGRLVGVTDAENKQSFFEYDGEGLKTSETDRRGIKKSFTYDCLGRLRRETLDTVSYRPWYRQLDYADASRLVTETDARGNQTKTTSDALGRPVRIEDPLGKAIERVYQDLDLRREKDKRGNSTLYEYDALHRLTKVTDPEVNGEATSATTQYKDADNQKVETDRRLIQTTTQMDPLGRVVSVTRAGTLVEKNTYDGDSNKTLTDDAETRKTAFAYDKANRLAKRTAGYGTSDASSFYYDYDAAGNKTRERDDRLPTPVRHEYWPTNRLWKTHVPLPEGGEATTTFEYDGEGNRTKVIPPKGEASATTYEYEELGKLRKVTQPWPAEGLDQSTTTYAYDDARNLTDQQDSKTHVRMTYDELNRIKTRTQDPDGLNLTTSHDEYDENGNLKEVTDPKGQTTTHSYDARNRLTSTTFALAPGAPEPWRYTTSIAYSEYDGNGNLGRIDETVASGTDPPLVVLTTTRSYDNFDRLLSETASLPAGGSRTVSYSYWANGLRQTVERQGEPTTTYAYDAQNRLTSAQTAGQTTSYTYFLDGLLQSVSYPSGVSTTHAYDPADRLVSLTTRNSAGAVLSSYAYTHDQNGNRLTQVETNGGTTETTSYTYDRQDRLVQVVYPQDAAFPEGRTVDYTYDPVGNRTGERVTATGNPAQVYTEETGSFDQLNRLTDLVDSVDPANPIHFDYDANGNQTAKTVGTGASAVTTTYRYDLRDKLVEAEQSAGVLGRFQYDAEGRRTLKIGEEGIRQYAYDGTSLLTEHDQAGAQVARYEYGSDRLISLTRSYEGKRYFSLDGLRSVVGLTDDAGEVKASYHLDAFGNFRFPTELDQSKNRFAFTGHVWDKETGLYHAKARYLDPSLGRFLTQDSFLGQIDAPPSLHRYLYAQDRPTYYIDPDGQIVFIPVIIAVVKVAALVGAIAAEAEIIRQEVKEGKDLSTVDYGKAAKSGAVAAGATAAGGLAGASALAGTAALGIGGAAGSAAISGTIGGAVGGYVGGAGSALADGGTITEAHDRGAIGALTGAVGGAAGYAGGSLAARAGAGRVASAFVSGATGDYGGQQTLVGTGLQERVDLRRSLAVGGASALTGIVAESPSQQGTPLRVGKWEGREVLGRRVYQRNDLFDPNRKTSWIDEVTQQRQFGTNVDRMRAGYAPVDSAGRPIQLHHLTGTEVNEMPGTRGALAETTMPMHTGPRNTGVLHLPELRRNANVPRQTIPRYPSFRKTNTGERSAQAEEFDAYRRLYWTERAKDFQ